MKIKGPYYLGLPIFFFKCISFYVYVFFFTKSKMYVLFITFYMWKSKSILPGSINLQQHLILLHLLSELFYNTPEDRIIKGWYYLGVFTFHFINNHIYSHSITVHIMFITRKHIPLFMFFFIKWEIQILFKFLCMWKQKGDTSQENLPCVSITMFFLIL